MRTELCKEMGYRSQQVAATSLPPKSGVGRSIEEQLRRKMSPASTTTSVDSSSFVYCFVGRRRCADSKRN